MKILFLVNVILKNQKKNKPYHYFELWPERIDAFRVIDTFNLGTITMFEKHKLRFYILQGIIAFFIQFFYDVIISDSAQSALTLAFLRSLFRIKHPPLVVIDVESFGRKRKGIALKIIKFAIMSINYVIYQATVHEKYYNEYLPELKQKSCFIPLGVKWSVESMDLIRKIDDEYVVSSGKQGKKFRDWSTLLNSIKPLASRIKLKIVGKERLVKGEDIDPNIEIPKNIELIPYTYGIEYSNIIYNSKFVILPLVEREQSVGQLTLLHAMALGKAVIVSDISGIRDYVRDGETAILYKPGDVRDLFLKIKYLLDKPEEATRIGKNAEIEVKRKFQFKDMVGKMYEVVRNITT